MVVMATATGFGRSMASYTLPGVLKGFAVVTHWSVGAVRCAGETDSRAVALFADAAGFAKHETFKAANPGIHLKRPRSSAL